MGNQGTTNWKLTAFFAITLMLIAGLFSTTAMAADGDGVLTVATPDGSFTPPEIETPNGTNPAHARLEAGGDPITLTFTYTLDLSRETDDPPLTESEKMNGGLIQIDIPADWEFAAVADFPDFPDAGVVVVDTGKGELLSGLIGNPVVIRLDDTWGHTAAEHTMSITFKDILVPIPDALNTRTDPGSTEADPYKQYEFVAKSRTRSGTLDTLNPTPDNPKSGNPFVRVGNIASGEGTVTVDPGEIYETYSEEDARRIEINFTATGPMWNSILVLKLPPQLDLIDSTAKSRESGYLSVDNEGGSDITSEVTGAREVTVTLKEMDTAQGVEIVYYSRLDSVTTETKAGLSDFVLTTDTINDNSSAGVVVTIGTGDPLTQTLTMTGRLLQKDGSGTMMADPMYVEVGSSGLRNFRLIYTAATDLEHTTLIIVVPDELLPPEDDDTAGTEHALQPTHDADDPSVAVDRNARGGGYVWTTDSNSAEDNLRVSGNTITWEKLSLRADRTFTTRIKADISNTVNDEGTIHDNEFDKDEEDDGIYPFATTIDTPGTGTEDTIALETDPPNDVYNDARLYAVKGDNENVTFELLDTFQDPAVDLPVPFVADADIQFHAADKETLIFRFTAMNTAIKGGRVSFKVPKSWTTPVLPNDDDNNAGRVKATMDADVNIAPVAAAIDKAEISPGRTTTITVDKLPIGGVIEVTYYDAIVQRSAGSIEIEGEFRTRSGASDRDAGTIDIEVLNVRDGSGEATISSGRSPKHSVKAGSVDNTITVEFTAAGTMNGGYVSLEKPDSWGNLQDNDDTEPNYVTVEASGRSASVTSNVGRDIAVANIGVLGYNNTITFTISGAEASSEFEVSEFIVESAGDADGELTPLIGQDPEPVDATAAELATGQIYWEENSTADADKTVFSDPPDVRNGILRINIEGAADGTGTATVEIRGSENRGKYGIDADGEADVDAVTRQVHAGDTGTYLLFTYTPTQSIQKGELRFTVPNDWSTPQGDEQDIEGYTYFREVGGAEIGPEVFDGNRVTAEIIDITRQDAIQIHYGWHGSGQGNAVAPEVAKMSTFNIQIQGSENGSPDRISKLPQVEVREQASGKGTATIAPASVVAGGTDTITITYTAIGEIEDGSLRLTVPDKWSDASSDNISVRGGGGSADYGRGYYDDEGAALEDNPDHVPGRLQVVYSSISLVVGGQVVFTYTTDVIAAIGDGPFTLEFQGGEGPDLDPKDPTVSFGAVSGDLTVKVGEAAAGDGDVAERGTDGIAASSEDNEISFVYVATGAISYPGTFAVRVPETWDADGPAASDYTVTYEDADGNELRGTKQSVEEAAPKDQDMLAEIRGANSPTITAGHQVVFTYTSAAPETPGSYDFTVFYDDAAVGTIMVNVLSAEEASAIELSSTESLDGTDTSVAITINLVDDTGTAATSSSNLTVELESDVATGRFSTEMGGTPSDDNTLSIVILSGQIEMMVYYQDATGDAAIVTATSDLPEVMVEIATDVLKVVAGSASVTITDSDGVEKDAAALGDTVTVSAMANGAPKFSIGDHVTGEGMEETATAGTYSGTWSPVNDLHDGTHTVTVTLGDTRANAGQITVDTKAPSVTVTAPAAGMTVLNGATITISATVTDATDVSVTADVSMLDSEAADSVTLTDGTGTHTIDMNNSNLNGEYTITVMATDAAGNSGEGTTTVMLDNTRSFTSMIPSGLSMFHVPLDVEGIDNIGQLKVVLGDDVVSVIPYHGGKWEPDSDDISITPDLGMFLVTKSAIEHEFVGHPWGGGSAMISVTAGANNLIGVPVDSGDMMISDIIGLFDEGVVQAIVTASGDGEYPQITGADDSDDAEVAGDAAYLVIATADATAPVSGAGWSNGTVGAAPIALSGYQLDTQTPLISVYGSVVDEITGLAKEGFRVKVKNLSTKAALSSIISVEAADGFNMTFVDLTDAHAARVGDVLEISVNSPDPFVGVKPARHIVTVDDVKNSRIQLEDLIAYEIPAETELLRNYPNPFNPETWIPYRLAEDADVSLTIYDANGALVRSIDVGHQSAAVYETRAKAIYWDGRNRFGEQVASGIYFYNLSAGDDFSGTRKMVILK